MAQEVLDREKLINTIWEMRGRVAFVAERLGVSTVTIYNYRDRYTTVARALEAAKQHNDNLLVDGAETAIHNAIIVAKGETAAPWAVRYVLANAPEAKRRGWGPRQEITGADGKAIKLTWGDSD